MKAELAISDTDLDRAILAWMQDLSPQGICITDAELRVQGWNSWLEINSGLEQESILGQNLLDLFPDLKTRRLEAYFNKALAGEVSVLSVAFHSYLFPFPPSIADSGFPHMLQTVRIAPLIQGTQIIGTITIIEDVTEREYHNSLLRKQHERKELLSWALSHLLESTEPEQLVKEIFPRISAHIGVDAYFNFLLDEGGTHLRLHSAGGVSSDIQKKYSTMKLGQHVSGTCALERRTIVGSEVQKNKGAESQTAKELGFTAYICHPLLADGKLIGTLAFATHKRERFRDDEIEFTKIIGQYVAIALERSRNVIALQSAQAKLQSHAVSLEKEVDVRTRELRESISELESFSYSLAHDVRAPLRHVRGYTSALLEDCGKEFSQEARTYVDLIIKAIHRLDGLTEDILAYGRLSQVPIRTAPVNLDELVNDIISHHPHLSPANVVTVKNPLHNPLAERPLLAQCLTNLLDNAVKFVPAGVTPRISIYTETKTEESTHNKPPIQWVRIFVEDNGIGIPEEFHARIFGIFERLGKENEFEGTGIGLAIVAKAMHRMGGRLGLSSEIGKGTKFWLELPAGIS